jgi:serine/threonine-protein kinase RsbW
MHSYYKNSASQPIAVDLSLEKNARRARLYRLADLARLFERLEDRMRVLGYAHKDLFSIRLALHEAVSNAIRHGNRGDPGKYVRVTYLVSPGEVLVEVRDQGPGFDPQALPDPLATENLDRPCGRGVFLMRAYTSWMRFNSQGNCVILCRRRTDP